MEKRINKNTEQLPCNSCGAALVFDPENKTLKCHYCGTSIETEELEEEIVEHVFNETLKNEPKEDWQGQTKLVKCENCGGETVFEKFTTADKCGFCGSPHVIKLSEFKGIKPESLIPFSISKKQVKILFKKWIMKKPFAPGSLKKEYTRRWYQRDIYSLLDI